jgi:hypothetical protein
VLLLLPVLTAALGPQHGAFLGRTGQWGKGLALHWPRAAAWGPGALVVLLVLGSTAHLLLHPRLLRWWRLLLPPMPQHDRPQVWGLRVLRWRRLLRRWRLLEVLQRWGLLVVLLQHLDGRKLQHRGVDAQCTPSLTDRSRGRHQHGAYWGMLQLLALWRCLQLQHLVGLLLQHDAARRKHGRSSMQGTTRALWCTGLRRLDVQGLCTARVSGASQITTELLLLLLRLHRCTRWLDERD